MTCLAFSQRYISFADNKVMQNHPYPYFRSASLLEGYTHQSIRTRCKLCQTSCPEISWISLQLNFLGSIAYLVPGSFLQDVLETVYAANSVKHILTGKAV